MSYPIKQVILRYWAKDYASTVCYQQVLHLQDLFEVSSYRPAICVKVPLHSKPANWADIIEEVHPEGCSGQGAEGRGGGGVTQAST